jgi:hypothetical protein
MERCGSHVVQRAVHGDPPQRFTVQDVSVMCPAGMHRELCEGVWPAADDDGGVVRRPLVAKVRPELFLSMLGHEILPTIAVVTGRRKQAIEQRNGGVGMDSGALAQRFLPAGLKGCQQFLPHPR